MTNNKNEGPGVLIIEDDTFFAEILEKNLVKKGFRVVRTPDLPHARMLLEKESFSIICFDIIVAGNEGFKKVSELTTDEHLKNTPILLLVDKELEADLTQNDAIGTFHYIVKPEASNEEIVEKIINLSMGTSKRATTK